MSRRETERILDAIDAVRAEGGRAALATVVRVRGSAYRREGTQILIREDGTHECLLSGGCLEPAVTQAAQQVIASGEPSLVAYDLEDDSVWGLGIGCTGAVDIYIERLEDEPATTTWLGLLRQREHGVLVTPLSGVSGRLVVRPDGETVGQLSRSIPAVVEAARERLRARFPQSGSEDVDGAELFFAVSVPPPQAVLFGAGHDAAPLAQGAWDLGFDVTVVDVRGAFLTADRFPHAARVNAHFSRFAELVRLGPRSFVVVMNHHLERDCESLLFALQSDAAYVGLLGPRSRLQKLVDMARSSGREPADQSLARVRNPIGLALGAETPEEVSVSILGEMLAIERGFDGGFLTGRETSLHRRDSRSMARS